MVLSVEEWTAGMDASQLRACLARFQEDIHSLRNENAELMAALRELRISTGMNPTGKKGDAARERADAILAGQPQGSGK
jgi:hypothetical protein